MRILTYLIIAGLWQTAAAAENELNQWHPLKASYKIHSGGTAYSEPPTKTDSALSVAITDETAKVIFNQIGPDVKAVCDDAKGYRERRKKGVFCSYTPRLENPKNSHYRCWLGIDLRTGDGDVRVSC